MIDVTAECLVRCSDSSHILFTATRVIGGVSAFLQLEGLANEGIITDGGDLTGVGTPVRHKKVALPANVKLRGQV